MKITKINLNFEQWFKVAIVLCAVAFIYSQWNKGRYQPIPSGYPNVALSILDTKTGLIYIHVADKKETYNDVIKIKKIEKNKK